MKRPWLLGIDTSSDWAGVSLTNGTVSTERNWNAGRQHTTSMLVEIDRLLTSSGIGVSDVGAVAVATGPGSFSGLRVGMSIAKGLVVASDIPLIGVSTLEFTLFPWRMSGHVVAVVKAGRARYVWCLSSAPETLNTGSISDLIAWCLTNAPDPVVGELDDGDDRLLTEAGFTVPEPTGRVRRAVWLAEIGRQRWQMGEFSDVDTLEPIYLHGHAAAS